MTKRDLMRKYLLVPEALVGLAFLIPAVLGTRPLLESVALSLLVTLAGGGLVAALGHLGNRQSQWALLVWVVLIVSTAFAVRALTWWIWPGVRIKKDLPIMLTSAPIIVIGAYFLMRRWF